MKKEDMEQLKKDALNIPNMLGYLRIVLIIVFAYLYINADSRADYFWSGFVIALSGVTDCLDGKIARKYNMVTNLGKILDPVADKITQGVLALCLMERFSLMTVLFIIFIIKEMFMALVGIIVLKVSGENNGAKWYGKVSTVFLYFVMIVLILCPNVSIVIANMMISVCIAIMLFSFVMYMILYGKIIKKNIKK